VEPGEGPTAPREPHAPDLRPGDHRGEHLRREHLFDHASILPEHLFAVNFLHNIELVFASLHRRC
jgi:hypothetical protein